MINFYEMTKLLSEYNDETEGLYRAFAKALDLHYNGFLTGNPPTNLSFTDGLIRKLGFNFSELKSAGVIVRSSVGNYELNKDLVATKGKLGTPPPVPKKPPSSWLPGGAKPAPSSRKQLPLPPPPPPPPPPRNN